MFLSAILTMVALLSQPVASFAQTTAKPVTNTQEQQPPSPAQIFAALMAEKDDAQADEGLFYFCDAVSDESVLSLTKKLEAFATDEDNADQPIRIIINSPGGSVFAGYALMDEIASVRGRGHHVKIVAYGMAASAAGWILQSADERVIGANSWILIHEVSTSASGKLATIETDLKFSHQLQDQFLLRLSQRSKLSLVAIHDHIDQGQDWWISAQDALAYGLVDSIEPVPAFPTPTPAKKK